MKNANAFKNSWKNSDQISWIKIEKKMFLFIISNVTNFKANFNHFVIFEAVSSGISLVEWGKKLGKAIIYVFQCFEINALNSYHGIFN